MNLKRNSETRDKGMTS